MSTTENVHDLSYDKFDLLQTFENGKGILSLPSKSILKKKLCLQLLEKLLTFQGSTCINPACLISRETVETKIKTMKKDRK